MHVATSIVMLALALSLAAAAQPTGLLRITVVLTGADGNATPIPRVVLLVSDNPATAEPRRVRTGADGAVEIRLPPGNYTVESDAPVTLGAQSYAWTQTIDITRGSNALSLTPANAEIGANTAAASGAGAPTSADSAVTFNQWRRSVVEIWTPTAHASGFVIDARGFIATNEPAMRDVTAVEVEFSEASNRFKVAGRVIAFDKQQGVAIIWLDPAAVSSIPAIAPDCRAQPGATVKYGEKAVALAAPMLEPKSAILGTVGRVETNVFNVDWRLDGDAAGGPVFDAGGRPIGITLPDEEREDSRRRDSQGILLSNACSVLAAAEKNIAGATPPPGTRLRVEDARADTRARMDKPSTFAPGASADKKGLSPQDPKAPRMSIPTVSSSNFDVALMTPAMVDSDLSRSNPRTDFGHWAEYVSIAPPVLLVRVTPQFEESVWKTILRGAAATQGAALPPLKSFTSSFLRLRAFCGAAEVTAIHPFTLAHEVPFDSSPPRRGLAQDRQDRASIREGLYVFALGDFGAHCATVRFDLYSEKSPDKADSLTVDAKLLAQITGR